MSIYNNFEELFTLGLIKLNDFLFFDFFIVVVVTEHFLREVLYPLVCAYPERPLSSLLLRFILAMSSLEHKAHSHPDRYLIEVK